MQHFSDSNIKSLLLGCFYYKQLSSTSVKITILFPLNRSDILKSGCVCQRGSNSFSVSWIVAAVLSRDFSVAVVLSGSCGRRHYGPLIDSRAQPGNSAEGSTLWGGCHRYPLCNFLLAGGWWLWLNLGFSPCHQHYCVGIPRVPALRILCHILSCQLWALPAGPVARHNTDYVSPTWTPAYAISPSHTHTHKHACGGSRNQAFSSPSSPLFKAPRCHPAALSFILVFCCSLEQCICPSCLEDQLGAAATDGLGEEGHTRFTM